MRNDGVSEGHTARAGLRIAPVSRRFSAKERDGRGLCSRQLTKRSTHLNFGGAR